ncbi:hypothetical protein D1AOALGA4SA_1487 [Olavius algarvensis Delta 1 endosymbiont]|nr:hypothetical protein D1AOALGA4SA_1487 [Olavius algarvensis Delta 1 endosymbiont]
MKAEGIPEDVKAKVKGIIEKFNQNILRKKDCRYQARFKGKYLYLDRNDSGNIGPIFRLTYTGKMNKWDFAIFRWSIERYDPDEWMFPGSQYLDGTVEGAMKAGLKAYPV